MTTKPGNPRRFAPLALYCTTAMFFSFLAPASGQVAPLPDGKALPVKTKLIPTEGKSLSGFLYHPLKADLSNGCSLKSEDNILDLQSIYFPETQQFYFRLTTAAAPDALEENAETTTEDEVMGAEQTTDRQDRIVASKGHQDAFWLVVSSGPNPKHHEKEMAIMYVDIPENRIVFYAYDGANGPKSYENSDYLGAVDDAIKIEDKDEIRTVSFLLDMAPVNDKLTNPEWKGTEFGDKTGFWFHTTFGADVQYGGTPQTPDNATTPSTTKPVTSNPTTTDTATTTATTTIPPEDTTPNAPDNPNNPNTPNSPNTPDSPSAPNPNATITDSSTVEKFEFAKVGPFLDTGNKETEPVAVTATGPEGKATLPDVEKAVESPLEKAGLAAADENADENKEGDGGKKKITGDGVEVNLGGNDKKRFSWCSLHDDLISKGGLGLENISGASVSGPKQGFTDLDTLEVPCLSSLKLYIDAAEAVESIVIEANGHPPVEMQLEKPAAKADKKTFVKEGAAKRFVVSNADGDSNELFTYGQNEFTLTLTVNGNEVVEDHQLVIPRP